MAWDNGGTMAGDWRGSRGSGGDHLRYFIFPYNISGIYRARIFSIGGFESSSLFLLSVSL